MTKDELRVAFLAMQAERRARVLSLLAHNLTICGRAASLPEVTDFDARMRLLCLNELLHVLTGHLMHIVWENTNRYPDEVILEILFEKAQIGHCESALLQALQWSCSVQHKESH